MDNVGSLLPVPVSSYFGVENQNNIKTVPKKHRRVFLFFFALYLISTLLGAALVPGRLEIEPESFVLSLTELGAFCICTERCFFALFMFFGCFSFLRFPVSFTFVVYEGIFTGIVIRLILYSRSYLISFAAAFLLACLIVSDVLASTFCACFDVRSLRAWLRVIFSVSFFALYILVSYFLSYIISLLF